MRLIIGLLILLLAIPANAEPLAIVKVLTGDSVALTDGRTIRLEAVKAPDAEPLAATSRTALEQWLTTRNMTLSHESTDRYGRTTADILGNKASATLAMVKAGQLFIYPPTGAEPNLPALLKAESEARNARRGLWADPAYADLTPDEAKDAKGHFAFVRGKIVDAARVKNKLYLNFGADWRTDFTAQIAAKDLRLFKKSGLDPLTLKGKTVRVRGMIENLFGPTITLTHPSQLEQLP